MNIHPCDSRVGKLTFMCGTMISNLTKNLTTQMIYLYFENLVYFTKYMKVFELFAEYDLFVLTLAPYVFVYQSAQRKPWWFEE